MLIISHCIYAGAFEFGFSGEPEDKAQMQRAVSLGERLFAKAKALGWKTTQDLSWSSNILGVNFENPDGTQMTLFIRAYDPFSAFETSSERIRDYQYKRASVRQKEDLGQVILKESPMYGHKDAPMTKTSTYQTFEGYKSPRGSGYIMGSAMHSEAPPFPKLGHNEPQANTFHQFWLFASVDDLVVEGWYYTRQRLYNSEDEDRLGQRDWNDNLIVNANRIARITDKVPGADDLRELAKLALGSDVSRDDNCVVPRTAQAFCATQNVVVFGQGTQEMRAYSKSLQKTYDAFANPAEFPSVEQAKALFAGFLKEARQLDQAVATAQTTLGSSDAVKVALINAPGYQIATQQSLSQAVFDHWLNHGILANERATATNEVLLAKQNVLSLNVVKALFKNYLDWSNTIPSASPESLLGLFGPIAEQVPWDMPRGLSGWLESAENDASILQKQAVTIKNLEALREFYLQRSEKAVNEMKALKKSQETLKELETLQNDLSNALYQLSHINRQ